jgi:hypothetical protein
MGGDLPKVNEGEGIATPALAADECVRERMGVGKIFLTSDIGQ